MDSIVLLACSIFMIISALIGILKEIHDIRINSDCSNKKEKIKIIIKYIVASIFFVIACVCYIVSK